MTGVASAAAACVVDGESKEGTSMVQVENADNEKVKSGTVDNKSACLTKCYRPMSTATRKDIRLSRGDSLSISGKSGKLEDITASESLALMNQSVLEVQYIVVLLL